MASIRPSSMMVTVDMFIGFVSMFNGLNRPTPYCWALRDLAAGIESNIPARIILQQGQSITRKFIAAHWKDCGVTGAESFVFQAKPVTPGPLTLVVKTSSGTRTAFVPVNVGHWNACRVASPVLQIKGTDVPKIQSVGFTNHTRAMQALALDEFMLRP